MIGLSQQRTNEIFPPRVRIGTCSLKMKQRTTKSSSPAGTAANCTAQDCCADVAQVSQPAVSPISKSAGRPWVVDATLSHRPQVWKPAVQVPEGPVRIARRFNAGFGLQTASSPAGTAENRTVPTVPPGRMPFSGNPGVETPGCYRMSLRDNADFGCKHPDDYFLMKKFSRRECGPGVNSW
jgi:hypothetical protein